MTIEQTRAERIADLLDYAVFAYLGSSIHVISVKKEVLSLQLHLVKDTVSAAASLLQPLVMINASFFDVDTLIPLFGAKVWSCKTVPIPGLPCLVIHADQTASITSSLPDSGEYIQTGPSLLSAGQSVIDMTFFNDNEKLFDSNIDAVPNPRSVFAMDASRYFFIAVDGRGKSRGLHIAELLPFLRHLDVTDAINLDGGSSTTLYAHNRVLNTPSGNSKLVQREERAVSTVLAGYSR